MKRCRTLPRSPTWTLREVQPLGTREQREIHLPRLRFLLVAYVQKSQIMGGQTQDEQEEMPCRRAQDERLDQKQAVDSLEDDVEQPT